MITMYQLLYNEYFHALYIFIVFIIVGEVFSWIVTKFIKAFVGKTKTDLDDDILEVTAKPMHLLILLGGLFFALRSLKVLGGYSLWVNRGFFTIAVMVVAVLLSKVLSLLITKWLHVQKKYEKTPKLINKIISITIYLIAVLMILEFYNIEISPLIATLGLGGLAVGLALQKTLTNLFAGLHIISDRPVSVGDFVEFSDKSGYVEDIGWRSTRVRTLPNTIIVVPNSTLAESIITNHSMPQQEMSCKVSCGVAYDSDLDKVEKVALDVARNIQQTVEGAVRDWEPFVRFNEFGDSNINFVIILRVQEYVKQYPVTHEFVKSLKKAFDKNNIEISWPVRKVYQGK
jgi:small-conductance mechanosensitive channel